MGGRAAVELLLAATVLTKANTHAMGAGSIQEVRTIFHAQSFPLHLLIQSARDKSSHYAAHAVDDNPRGQQCTSLRSSKHS